MPKFKTLGDRCKFYEQNGSIAPYINSPMLCRIDGKAFHSFCRGLHRPFDKRLSDLMVDTARFLLEETCANWVYTQSDEISLCWIAEDDTQLFFDGKTQKVTSITASMATYYFNKNNTIEEKKNTPACFDSRCWGVPNLLECYKYLLWRQNDATRNAISMAAQSIFSHNALQKKKCGEMQEMLWQKGINFNEYPSFFKRGTFLRRVKRQTKFTIKEIDKLPLQHEARKNPNLLIERTVLEVVDLPPLNKVENKLGVLFQGEEPHPCIQVMV